jgi:transcription elongation GreA/GreB family factor
MARRLPGGDAACVSERRAEPAAPARDGEVEIGERVTVLDLTTSLASDYRVTDSDTARASAGEISHRSRLGAALLGRHVGDVVEIGLSGRIYRLEVVEIDG